MRARKLPGTSRYEYRGYEVERMENGWVITPPGALNPCDVCRTKRDALALIDQYEMV